jgi:hypothetical protein
MWEHSCGRNVDLMSERTPEELLEAIESLDTVIGETFPAGALQVVNRPAAIRSIENLWIARRTLGSIHHLMAYTVTGKDRDRTEDAAVLVRRLLELLADTFWLTDWDETSPDDQALRSLLGDYDERRKKLEMIQRMESGTRAAEKATASLAEQANDVAFIAEELEANGAPTSIRASTFDILYRVKPSLAFYWRFESDVAHAGMVGRNLQRTKEIDIGADAPGWRRNLVLETSLAATADLFVTAIRLHELPEGDRLALEGHVAALALRDQESE